MSRLILLLLLTGCGPSFSVAEHRLNEPDAQSAPDVDSDGGAPSPDAGGEEESSPGDAGPVKSDAGPPGDAGMASDGCTYVTHRDGFGQTWTDCAPLGTYDYTEANDACNAYAVAYPSPGSTCRLVMCPNASSQWAVAYTAAGDQTCFLSFVSSGDAAGRAGAGGVSGCECPTSQTDGTRWE
jgi:hypothetical protein